MSNASQVLTQAATLELFISFHDQKVYSKVTYSLLVLSLSLSKLTFDTLNLKIKAVSLGSFALGAATNSLGTPLIVTLDTEAKQGEVVTLSIEAECGAESLGLVWMTAEQTTGKQHPFLFTQFEPIYCRSLVPIQDLPSVKFPVKYQITVPKPLRVVTAAAPTHEETLVPGHTTFFSHMQYPIPAYLIAFAAGDIAYRDIGPRSRVYAEPEVVEAAAWEFADTERMLSVGVGLLTPYEWGKYDLLVLPPAFPYGGMENPTLTFMTPTVLAGDRSLVSIVAHELAHSWAGNLVTNKSWEHFWLNEGLTTYIENRIMRELLGDSATDVIVDNQIKSLETFIQGKMTDSPGETRLKTELGENNPDDTYSIVPYYKGMCFFVHLEGLVGGPVAFLPFLREYFHHFAFKSLDSYEFKDFFTGKFPEISVDWDLWLHGEGMPVQLPSINISLVLAQVQSLLDHFLDPGFTPQPCDIADWSIAQVTLFLKKVEKDPLPQHLQMATAYGLSTTRNKELQFYWLSIVLRLKAENHYAEVVAMLSSQGRMKYVRPLFRLLESVGEQSLARSIFAANKSFYSLIVRRLLLQTHPWLSETS